MTQAIETECVFEYSGGELCLDFANTMGGARVIAPKEHLHAYRDLVAWARQASLLGDGEARDLAREAERRPDAAKAVLGRAVELREAIWRIFSSRSAGSAPSPEDLALLNDALPVALSQLRISLCGGGFTWQWAGERLALDRMLWPVIRSAADLLTSERIPSLRECASDSCTWLFMDRSRNASRRWCDMKSCGNRQKARRHYRRKKGEPPERPNP